MITQDPVTVGRKVWYWMGWMQMDSQLAVCLDKQVPFDATVVFVRDDGTVNLQVRDHAGNQHCHTNIDLHDPLENPRHGDNADSLAQWMPYQKKQHDKQKEQEANGG